MRAENVLLEQDQRVRCFSVSNRVIHTQIYQLLIPLHVVKVHWLILHGEIALENQILTIALTAPCKVNTAQL